MKNMVGDENNSRFLKLEEEYDKIYIQNNDIMVSAFKNKGKMAVVFVSSEYQYRTGGNRLCGICSCSDSGSAGISGRSGLSGTGNCFYGS